jgi:hypothetical protein
MICATRASNTNVERGRATKTEIDQLVFGIGVVLLLFWVRGKDELGV